MRARYPDIEGFVERDGVKVAYEVFGAGQPALVFAPTDPLVHSRAWNAPFASSCREETEAVLTRVNCPVLAIHGRQDRCQPWRRGERLAEITRGELLLLEGPGTCRRRGSQSSSIMCCATSRAGSGLPGRNRGPGSGH